MATPLLSFKFTAKLCFGLYCEARLDFLVCVITLKQIHYINLLHVTVTLLYEYESVLTAMLLINHKKLMLMYLYSKEQGSNSPEFTRYT